MPKLDVTKLSRNQKIALFAGIVVAAIAICILLTWLLSPLFTKLADPDAREAFELWVESLGFLGVLLMLFIQVLQIVIAFIPGEVVQVMAGVMYGTWGGLALCIVGCVLASALVFVVIRKLGRPFVVKLFGEEQLSKYSFLNDSEKVTAVVFILFLIPGVPKDLLTYFVPLSNISLTSFLVVSNIGRLPGQLASTLIGSNIMDANWPLIITVFILVAVFVLIGIFKKDEMLEAVKSLSRSKKQRDDVPEPGTQDS